MIFRQGRSPLLLSLIRRLSDQKQNQFYFHPGFNPDNKQKFAESFLIFDNFVTDQEEKTFMKEMEPHLKRHVYEKDHWDDVSLIDFF